VQNSTALRAIRSLGVDIANITTKCAVFQAAIEELHELTPVIDMRSWETQMMGEGEGSTMVIVVPLDQREVVEQILNIIDGLR